MSTTPCASSSGYTREEFLQMGIDDLNPNHSARRSGSPREFKTRGIGATEEAVAYRKDGTYMHVEISASFVEYEGEQYYFLFSRDITKRKELEESLRLTQISVDRTGDMIFWINAEGRVYFANDSACSQLGYTRAELRQLTYRDLTVDAPEDWRMVFEST